MNGTGEDVLVLGKRCMSRLQRCTRTETLTGCSVSVKSGRSILKNSASMSVCASLPTKGRSRTGKAMRSALYEGSTTATAANGGESRGVGMPRGWDYKALVEKYLNRTETTDNGIWETRQPEVLRMYKVLARLGAAELTIFLLVVELETIAEVARRLKVHRSTIGRIYHRIEQRLRDDIQRY